MLLDELTSNVINNDNTSRSNIQEKQTQCNIFVKLQEVQIMNSDVIRERREDILKIVEGLDITPTMYNNAVEKYEAIAKFLDDKGIDAHLYPQGSFSIGTVVKPQVRKRQADYDLDVICEVNYNKNDITPDALYEELKDALKSDGRYSPRLDFYDECITVNYSDVNGVGFSIDLVPSVHETPDRIISMKSRSLHPDLCDTSIAITKDKAYDWGSSNPKGYQSWFESVNQKFIDYGVHTNVNRLLLENRSAYTTADDIPKPLIRTPLQRVIQLLKAHNNEYFNKPQIKDYKVKSVIIATLATTIAKNAPTHYNTFELLDYVVNELAGYSLLRENHILFKSVQPLKTLIRYDGKEWNIANPSNPDDNLADSWNENSKNATYFFNWINAVLQDFNSLNNADNNVGVINIFGESMLSRTDSGKKYIPQRSSPVSITAHNKPWRAQ